MKLYAVIDIETTGGQITRDRITEIAILLYDGEKIIDEFQTLIHPERMIPYNITQLTGIDDEMVQDAPKFYEVAKRIVEITKGAIFVAHNVGFDYKFIKEEFARLGFVFTRKQLCTVRLSRQGFPGRRSYSLGSMIDFLGIQVKNRHRAMDDAKAALIILQTIFSQEKEDQIDLLINQGVQASKLPPNITLEQLHEFPEECGVYYFHNANGDVIYTGKSINIKKRLLDHFANNTQKAMRMIQSVHEITYQLTGSELVALLYESHEIKQLKPIYNQAQRRTKYPIGIYHYTNEQGFICFNLAKEDSKFDLIARYERTSHAQSALKSITSRYRLCPPFCGLEGLLKGNCLNFQIGLCEGACSGNESIEDYNHRANKAIEQLKLDFDINFIVLEEGRTREEEAVVLVQDGGYKGFGYIDKEDVTCFQDYLDCIRPFQNNPDTSRIMKDYLKTSKSHRIIRFPYQ
jgi:DNA polymerase III subunit epsilon